MNLTEKISQKVVEFFRKTIESEENVAADMVEESAVLLRKVSENPYSLRAAYQVCEALYSLTESSPVVLADEINRELLGKKTALTETYLENLLEAAEVVLETENGLFTETFRKALKEALPVIARLDNERLLLKAGMLLGETSLAERKVLEDALFVSRLKVEKGLNDKFIEGFLKKIENVKVGERKPLEDIFFYAKLPEVKTLAVKKLMDEFGETVTPSDFRLYISELRNARAKTGLKTLIEKGLEHGLIPQRIKRREKNGEVSPEL